MSYKTLFNVQFIFFNTGNVHLQKFLFTENPRTGSELPCGEAGQPKLGLQGICTLGDRLHRPSTSVFQ